MTVKTRVSRGDGLRGDGGMLGDYIFSGRAHGTEDGYDGVPKVKPFDGLNAARKAARSRADIHEDFQIGDIVRHPKFGDGMLIEQDDKTMTVMFDEVGQKKLGKGFVKMEKVTE